MDYHQFTGIIYSLPTARFDNKAILKLFSCNKYWHLHFRPVYRFHI